MRVYVCKRARTYLYGRVCVFDNLAYVKEYIEKILRVERVRVPWMMPI